ncbi:MAG: aconitate hydratase AcnA [Candidatus Lutacidiplasmatales archaeon]
MKPSDPLGVIDSITVDNETSQIYRLDRIVGVTPAQLAERPVTVRILLENLLRHYDPKEVDPATLRALATGSKLPSDVEIPFRPSRVLLQDFTGIPLLVDLTAMRSAAAAKGLGAERVNPLIPVDLVVDHSVQVDSFGTRRSVLVNLDREYDRNSERYRLLRWAQGAFEKTRIVPPGNGICHQVNLEYLATVVTRRERNGLFELFPDTLFGTDSHTTMVNGLGVLGWGVGGIEAEAALLGEPTFLSPPRVVGVRLTGSLPEGSTATDLVLTVTHALRQKGVVDQFVEFFGPGLAALSVPDRATLSNMCPEYGATSAIFPVDEATLGYLRGTGRTPHAVSQVEAYARRQGLFFGPGSVEPRFDDVLEVDLSAVRPTVSGPRNPEEAVLLEKLPEVMRSAVAGHRRDHPALVSAGAARAYPADDQLAPYGNGNATNAWKPANPAAGLADGSVVIAAITSCTNTSNPSVMVGAGLIAKRAVERGLKVPPHVKTSLAPGSKVVSEYLSRAGLMEPLEQLGFNLVGYGCTTCIGNSGPLVPEVEEWVRENDGFVSAVLSGNRNFEARIHNLVRANFLGSPMLVVAFALAGRTTIDLSSESLGTGLDGRPVFLKELWPSAEEVRRLVEMSMDPEVFREKYRKIFVGDAHWDGLQVPIGSVYPWEGDSTYLREAPYFSIPIPKGPEQGTIVRGARVLATLGDRVSTDHISPAGAIDAGSPAGAYLKERGVPEAEFNTYGARRGNHEVMVRGTFANVRLKNQLAAPREGGLTVHLPSGGPMTIYDAAERYRKEGVPLIVLAGANYGQGSSRDWAAKGPLLLGVRAVVAESFERIHRSNLVGMGILPLEFPSGTGWKNLGLTGRERYALQVDEGSALTPRCAVDLVVEADGQAPRTIRLRSRIDSAVELDYYQSGGLLPYVLGRLGRPR